MADNARRMVITGASGVVGKHTAAMAIKEGWQVDTLTRGAPGPGPGGLTKHRWNPAAAAKGDADAVAAIRAVLEGADALVNLAGAGVGDRRLTDSYKKVVIDSRVDSAHACINAWMACEAPPTFWLQASAVGYYGDTGEAVVHDEHPPGNSFLSEVCMAWEQAALDLFEKAPHARDTVRMAIARIGLVFAKDAQAWTKMIQPIKMGVGGKFGDGTQYYPWLDADDLARMILFLYEAPDVKGPYNFVGPEPIQQKALVSRVAKRLSRPAFIPAPGFALKAILGDFAAALLDSNRAVPTKLEDAGFKFNYDSFEAEMDHLLG